MAAQSKASLQEVSQHILQYAKSDPQQALGWSGDMEDLAACFKALARRLHPDKAASILGHAKAVESFQLLTVAYETLKSRGQPAQRDHDQFKENPWMTFAEGPVLAKPSTGASGRQNWAPSNTSSVLGSLHQAQPSSAWGVTASSWMPGAVVRQPPCNTHTHHAQPPRDATDQVMSSPALPLHATTARQPVQAPVQTYGWQTRPQPAPIAPPVQLNTWQTVKPRHPGASQTQTHPPARHKPAAKQPEQQPASPLTAHKPARQPQKLRKLCRAQPAPGHVGDGAAVPPSGAMLEADINMLEDTDDDLVGDQGAQPATAAAQQRTHDPASRQPSSRPARPCTYTTSPEPSDADSQDMQEDVQSDEQQEEEEEDVMVGSQRPGAGPGQRRGWASHSQVAFPSQEPTRTASQVPSWHAASASQAPAAASGWGPAGSARTAVGALVGSDWPKPASQPTPCVGGTAGHHRAVSPGVIFNSWAGCSPPSSAPPALFAAHPHSQQHTQHTHTQQQQFRGSYQGSYALHEATAMGGVCQQDQISFLQACQAGSTPAQGVDVAQGQVPVDPGYQHDLGLHSQPSQRHYPAHTPGGSCLNNTHTACGVPLTTCSADGQPCIQQSDSTPALHSLFRHRTSRRQAAPRPAQQQRLNTEQLGGQQAGGAQPCIHLGLRDTTREGGPAGDEMPGAAAWGHGDSDDDDDQAMFEAQQQQDGLDPEVDGSPAGVASPWEIHVHSPSDDGEGAAPARGRPAAAAPARSVAQPTSQVAQLLGACVGSLDGFFEKRKQQTFQMAQAAARQRSTALRQAAALGKIGRRHSAGASKTKASGGRVSLKGAGKRTSGGPGSAGGGRAGEAGLSPRLWICFPGLHLAKA